MILSFVGPAVHSKWGLTSHEESIITTVVFAGGSIYMGRHFGQIWKEERIFCYSNNDIHVGNNHLPESRHKDVAAAPPPPPPPKQKDSHMGVFKSMLMLFPRRLVRSTLLLRVVISANAFSYYGLVLMTTDMPSN
uniref:Uncharacterized protein n=1 Tax=Salix viminalis TaxID=40686 RepID=A0A6N2LRC1_SALVM